MLAGRFGHPITRVNFPFHVNLPDEVCVSAFSPLSSSWLGPLRAAPRPMAQCEWQQCHVQQRPPHSSSAWIRILRTEVDRAAVEFFVVSSVILSGSSSQVATLHEYSSLECGNDVGSVKAAVEIPVSFRERGRLSGTVLGPELAKLRPAAICAR